MTESFSVLQKKLQELESALNDALLLPSETQCHHIVSEGIKQRFIFIKNLLAAEIGSHPSKPQYLQHIVKRLDKLEKAFEEWDSFRTLAFDQIENASTCSCTDSCFNDDGEAFDEMGSPNFEDPEKFSQGFVGDSTALLEFDSDLVKERGLVENDEKESVGIIGFDRDQIFKSQERSVMNGGVGRLFGVMASGIVLGMVLMYFTMVRFSGCFYYVKPASFTVPT
ncbi:putative Transmembrane protein [Quillaja saponaria]|uniref:Transmembrane protein n=1 Tax=Quillaja saponaria TaxID=32244 RepID=A0AAD7PBN6_QUISA|nr:putative Transmembrane protein [Quillaja saponaria]